MKIRNFKIRVVGKTKFIKEGMKALLFPANATFSIA
jgi:hypothetical protein